MNFPRFQFTTSTLLLGMAFLAICLGSIPPCLSMRGIVENVPWQDFFLAKWVVGPLWLPFLFAAYALGRGAITLKLVFVFAVTQAAALGSTWWLVHLWG